MLFDIPDTPVRLLGSMHLLPASQPELPSWVRDAYLWADTLIFESDAPAILPLLKAPSGTSLEAQLPPDVWRTLVEVWPTGGPLAPLDALHPWAALIVAPTLFQRVAEGVEPHLHAAALAHEKPFSYLESAESIAQCLESIPSGSIIDALSLLVSDLGEPQRTLEAMHTAWRARDLDAVERIAAQSPMFGVPHLRRAVLEDRNRAWAPRIEAAFAGDRNTLVVVGALHLCGQGNLIERLGREVVPV